MDREAYKERVITMLKRIEEKILVRSYPIEKMLYVQSAYKSGNRCPVLTAENAAVFERESLWGGCVDAHAWFYATVDIPEREEGVRYELKIRTDVDANGWDASNPQFIVYMDGKPVQGMDLHHTSVLLPLDKKRVGVHIYAYTGTNLQPSAPLKLYVDVCAIDEACEKLYYDLAVPFEVLKFSKENTKEYLDILGYLNAALNALDWRNEKALRHSFALASKYLEEEFYEKYCTKGDIKVKCIGHTHIDIAWLWTVRQTREKAQRSFFTVLELMNRYPDYKFMSSQVPLYKAIKEEAPEKYEEIKRRVKEGRWEVEGAMWVEADCNLTSGESLVRQILYGKRFFKEEFGIDSKVLWLPDVFGYAAALPQILKKSGVDKFVTSKISWNDRNTLPTDTFLWKGIDGTDVFTYFMTAQQMRTDDTLVNFTTYCPTGSVSYVMGAWRRYQNKDVSNEVILTYGWGDGGGGPTHSDMEMLRRMEYGIPNCPTTEFCTATQFLNEVETQSAGKLEYWTGELYFEFHRGTYTSQAKLKKNNRKAEFALQNLEWLATLSRRLFGVEYPQEALTKMWETVLTNQFHDILPGSSIQEVYTVANEEYEKVLAECDRQIKALALSAAKQMHKEGLLVYNPTSFPMGGTVRVDGKTRYVEDIPAFGYAVVQPATIENRITHTGNGMENDYFLVEFDKNWEICRLYDKRNGREVLPKGKTGNRLVLFEDFTYEFDAWELRQYYTQKSYPVLDVEEVAWVEDGERCGFKIKRKTDNSTVMQTIWLYEHIERIDVDNEIEWREKHHVLKAFFPVDVNAEKATFDIQFGNYERSTHDNTTWQQAQFEVCAQKFADLSDSGYGMAILNDCKYGYSVKHGEMGITLLKAPTYPDPDCDEGVHTFTYSFYPHADDLRHSKVYEEAYRLNNPMFAVKAEGKGSVDDRYSFVSVNKENVIIDTVKQAENGEGTIIRLYESMNKSTSATLTFDSAIKGATLCDLLENEERRLPVIDGSITLFIKPFEIVTLKIR